MTDYFEMTLDLVRSEIKNDGAPSAPRELLQNDISQRLSSILSNLDDLISLSRDFESPDIQRAICAEEKAFGSILARAQLLASFIEACRPQGLRLVGGRK